MNLIVGLGNPGRRYAATRHNVGWRVMETLRRRWGGPDWRETFQAELAECRPRGRRVALVRPLTYMNRSGGPVSQAAAFWKVAPADVLVVLDDMALPLGRLRLKAGGSDGGHNGLASVLQALGTTDVPRLRAGIGPAPLTDEHVDFVLSPFREGERPAVDRMVDRAADAALCWLTEGLDEAMTRFNRPVPDDGDA